MFDSETGKFKRMWGAFGNPPPPTFAANAAVPQPQTTPDGPPEFGLPHAVKVSRDGIVYLADRINNRIQLFTTEGKYLRQVRLAAAQQRDAGAGRVRVLARTGSSSISTSSIRGRCRS